MRNVTWIVRWFRLSCRPLPVVLAVALGMLPAISVRADDDGEELAPVLRLARPYPELKSPPIAALTKPQASTPQTVQPQDGDTRANGSRVPVAGESSRRQVNVPTQNTLASPPTNMQVSDGWVARDMIGKREPLTDPSTPKVQTPRQPPAQTPLRTTPQAPAATPSPAAQPLPVIQPSVPRTEPVAETSSPKPLQAVQPAEEVTEVAPSIVGWQSNWETNGNEDLAPSDVPISAPRSGVSLTSPVQNGVGSNGSVEFDNPVVENVEVDNIDVDMDTRASEVDDEQSSGSPELQRMLRELERMKRVAPMKSVAAPTATPDTPARTPEETEPAKVDVPPSLVEPRTEPSTAENLRPLARPALAEPAPTSSRRTIARPSVVQPSVVQPSVVQPESTSSADSKPQVRVESPAASEADISEPAITAPAITRPAEDNISIEDLRDSRELEIPVRRPTIEPRKVESTQRDVSPNNVDQNSRARDLQEQIERFERGESIGSPKSNLDVQDDSLDAAVEPLEMRATPLPKQVQPLPQKLAPVISAAVQRLDQPIRQALMYYHQRPENAAKRTPWGMLHAILPYGIDANVDANRRYNAIAYLAGNNPNRNLRMLTVTRGGRLVARSGVGLQGHQAQMLAIFAQVGVPADYPLYVQRRKFIMNDLVKTEMLACKAGEELTFTLIGLSHFLPTDTKWRAADGQMWDFERLLSEEMSQPVVGAACGGTHRLMGLSYALKQRKLEGLPITGQWARAQTYLSDFEAYAWQLQNRDGSFSTNWFEGRADNGDLDRKVQTTGHILEWLLFVTEDDGLQDERVTRAITYLASNMINERNHEWQVGPKGHALRALSVYHRRVFNSDRPWLPDANTTAQQSPRSNQRR